MEGASRRSRSTERSKLPIGISPSTKRMLITAAIIFGALALLFVSADFWVDWMWFGSLGFRRVFLTRFYASAAVFAATALVTFGLLILNVVIALRRTRPKQGERNRVVLLTNRLVLWITVGGTIAVSLLVGWIFASDWDMWWLFVNGASFGVEDPAFGRDVGFYVFALPALDRLSWYLLGLLILAGIGAGFIYVIRLGVNVRNVKGTPRAMRVHILTLLGLVFATVAFRHWLANFHLAYSERGAVFGAGYTDVRIVSLTNWLLAITALLVAVILIANARFRAVKYLVWTVGVWAVLFVVAGQMLPGIVQSSVVEPSELNREAPYIANNIEMTRSAFALDTVVERETTGQAPVTGDDFTGAPQTVANTRLWDYRVIRGTYQQLQSFAPYYVFLDADVDRYLPDGEIEQVVVSAREIDQNGLPQNARTWTNERLVYTHGYGVVLSPVGEVSQQGLPIFRVERIPPTGDGVYGITRPEIYFGEADLGWVIVRTDELEFSGAIGDGSDTTFVYDGLGAGSVTTSNYLSRVLVSASLGDRNILLSNNINTDSQVLLHRNIVDRAKKIAPFLTLDDDPYIVIADGRLYWVIDAYTTTDRWPHATRIDGVNYIRNSVKIVIDAYDGTTTFYRTGTPDPIADAYMDIYPTLFRPIAEAPAAIAAHFRFPEHLFDIQSEAFATYHVTNPGDFYNGEDRWSVPEEQVAGQLARMEPYYVTMTLPGETETEFMIIRPFVPGGQSTRQNMTAWMAGRAASDGQSNLVVYRFPRQETVYGPRQIEARIDQEPTISSQLTLWSQSGSNVIRGNLLVIPIGSGVIYVQPLYLVATNSTAALPELRRVIVATNEKVVMAETFPEAIRQLVGESPPPTGEAGQPTPVVAIEGVPQEIADLVQQATVAWQDAQAALQRGDWAAYGEAQTRLQAALSKLAALTGQETVVPVPAATPEATTPEATPTPSS